MICSLLATVVSGSLQPATIEFREGLGIQISGNRRGPVRIDPIEESIVRGEWKSPKAGDSVGSRSWVALTAGADGTFGGPVMQGGYVLVTVRSDAQADMLLEAKSYGMVYVNGQPYQGDIYGYGYVSHPIRVNRGVNEFLFTVGRGGFSGRLIQNGKSVSLDTRDLTLPDRIAGESKEMLGALVVRNGRSEVATSLVLESTAPEGKPIRRAVPAVLANSHRKVPFTIPRSDAKEVVVRLLDGTEVLDETKIDLRAVSKSDTYKRTFLSEIDGSLQYYAVNPSSNLTGRGQALFLSLHGASVEALGQAQAYGQKDWGHLVAPTNRRPFGFNWEDIGRLDALEVLELARKELKTDPKKTYLTGHSMGGHGTWQLGAHFPSYWAGIAPAAGWVSYWSYGGAAEWPNPSPIERLLRRAMNASDTRLLERNYGSHAVFILHGDADSTVSVNEPRTMRDALSPWHKDFHYHEEPGQGHWYDTDPAPGANCVDYAPIFDLFRKREIPVGTKVRNLEFATISPGISATHHWATIAQQIRSMEVSKVDLALTPRGPHLLGTTSNVRRLELDMRAFRVTRPVRIVLDDQPLVVTPNASGRVNLVRSGDTWIGGGELSRGEKSPMGSGSFKDIFRNRLMFVVGTGGTGEEDQALLDGARYLSEQFRYTANGAIDVVLDTAFDARRAPRRNVLLFGNADTNRAFSMMGGSPVSAKNGEVSVGEKRYSGADHLLLAIRPQRDDSSRFVACIAPTGLTATRMSWRMPYLTAGSALPDFAVFSTDMLRTGSPGVKAAGFFGFDWKLDPDQTALN